MVYSMNFFYITALAVLHILQHNSLGLPIVNLLFDAKNVNACMASNCFFFAYVRSLST